MKFAGVVPLLLLATAMSSPAMALATSAKSDSTAKLDSAAPHFTFAAQIETEDVWFPRQVSESAGQSPFPLRAPPEPGSLLPRERALIPLPAAAWTGLMGLGGVAILVGRKGILSFVS